MSRRVLSPTKALLFTFLSAVPSAFAAGAGGGLPWETPLNRIAQSLTGPVALSISLIALNVARGRAGATAGARPRWR